MLKKNFSWLKSNERNCTHYGLPLVHGEQKNMVISFSDRAIHPSVYSHTQKKNVVNHLVNRFRQFFFAWQWTIIKKFITWIVSFEKEKQQQKNPKWHGWMAKMISNFFLLFSSLWRSCEDETSGQYNRKVWGMGGQERERENRATHS